MNLRLLKISKERQDLYARLAALEKEEYEILTGTERSEQIDYSLFKDTTGRLLTEFMNAKNNMLSHEDIRQDVMFDDEASDRAVRQVIVRARREIKACDDFHYEIKNIKEKGYKLIETANATNAPCPPKKSRKI
jgi:DNA-binding response OmpR family regulator